MDKVRKYGVPPFVVAVIHGGPGAPGEMAPMARTLAKARGVLEPLQSAMSVDGQVEELRSVLEEYADAPQAESLTSGRIMTLIGSSWGAWLALIVAAEYPALVRKLILVGSAPLEERYAAGIEATRLGRLTHEERAETQSLMLALREPERRDKGPMFARLGELFSKADAFDPVRAAPEVVAFQPAVYESVWAEASELRRSGELLRVVEGVQCPVLAVHGDFDPHPAEGVREPLSRVLRDFRFVLLKKCGHHPWIELQARDRFYRIVRAELLRS